LTASETTKAKVLSHVYTLDLPSGSLTERIKHLLATDKERLLRAVLLDIVPLTPGEERWVGHDVAKTPEEPAESARTLLATEYGVSLYRLARPVDIIEATYP